MKNVRKYLTMAGIATAVAVMPITAYGGILKGSQSETVSAGKVAYEFKSGDTMITMGAESKDVIKALGNPVKPVFEQESCAYQGKDKVYTYEGFELSTYPADGKEYISSVYIPDKSSIATPEGIKIGSTAKEVVDIYGKEYDKEEAKFGTYCYTSDSAVLKIYTAKDKVDSIEYLINTKK